MREIIRIDGIGETYAEELKVAGIATTEALLEQGSSREGRRKIAENAGIRATLVLCRVNHADPFRIKGIEGQYAELLEAAGVDSIPELAQRMPANLVPRLAEVDDQEKLVRKLPTEDQVAGWVAQAETSPTVVHHRAEPLSAPGDAGGPSASAPPRRRLKAPADIPLGRDAESTIHPRVKLP